MSWKNNMQKVVIAGLGLLGGSMALKLKSNADYFVTAYGRNLERMQIALDGGMVDQISNKPEEVIPDADIIILCTPVDIIPIMLEAFVPFLKEGAVLTDIGSTKDWIGKNVQRVLGVKAGSFLGAHPMAGSEKAGYENADVELFEGKTIVLTPMGNEFPETLKKVQSFWELFTSNILSISPEEHDKVVAMTSHLPHIIAFSMAYHLSGKDEAKDNFFNIYGNGLKDTLRIAASDEQMWSSVINSNRQNIADSIEEFRGIMQILENWIRTGHTTEIVDLIKKAGKLVDQLF